MLAHPEEAGSMDKRQRKMGGKLINFLIFSDPPELIRISPPSFINFQGMMKYKIFLYN